jgi:hypothetical protein
MEAKAYTEMQQYDFGILCIKFLLNNSVREAVAVLVL